MLLVSLVAFAGTFYSVSSEKDIKAHYGLFLGATIFVVILVCAPENGLRSHSYRRESRL